MGVKMPRKRKDKIEYWKPEHLPVALADKEQFPSFWKLSLKQRQFVLNFLIGPTRFNATKSAQAAGYAGRTHVAAYMLRHRPCVDAAIRELTAVMGLTPDFIKTRLGEIAAGVDMADMEDYIQGKASLGDLREKGVNTLALRRIQKTVEKDGTEHVVVEARDPIPALREAAKIAGLVKDSHEFNVNLNFGGMSVDELKRYEHAIAAAEEKRKATEIGYAIGTAGALNPGRPGLETVELIPDAPEPAETSVAAGAVGVGKT